MCPRETDDDLLEAAETEIHLDRQWPVLDPVAFHGAAGTIVRALAPTTEADPVALLADLLASFGWLVRESDASAHLLIGNSRHDARVWPLIVGTTSSGAKGTSRATVQRVIGAAIQRLDVSPQMRAGLSSGEGLIESVRDASGDEDSDKFDPGVDDKRLLVIEPEFASVLKRANREGNTLGQVLRGAWDGGTLAVMNRRALVATNPHVVVIGHISPGELSTAVRSSDVDGGTLNRLLFVCSRRSQRLPDGGNAPERVVTDSATRVAVAVANAQTVGEMEKTVSAQQEWRELYMRLTGDRPDTPLTKATGRRAPFVLRLAMLYALLDSRPRIDVGDLRAAAALEQYSVDSAAYIFEARTDREIGDSAKLLEFITASGEKGVSREDIRGLFSRKKLAAEIDRLLKPLLEDRKIEQDTVETPGRSATKFYAQGARKARVRAMGRDAA